nr:AT-rich interactive domain-containing protein 1A [Drosophila takahashii]
MGAHPRNLKLLFLWTCLTTELLLTPGATGVVQVGNPIPGELLQRSKRTMTTICVEIRPSSPQDEPYYMCRGANFGGENGQQSCVEVRNQGGQGEPFYMCREAGSKEPDVENRPTPKLSPPISPQYAAQHDSVHNFPLYPAFEGGSFPQQAFPEDPINHAHPAGPPSYQEKPHRQPLPQQHQPHSQYGYYGSPMAAPSPAPPAQSYGLPELPQPTEDSPPAAPPGFSAGPGPTSTPPSHDPAAPARSSNRPNENVLVGSSRHPLGFEDDVLAVPNLGFKRAELDLQYRRPVNPPRPQDQLMWVPLSHKQEPENDPVMKAFYSSVSEYPTQEAMAHGKQATVPIESMGQLAPGYSPFDSQYPGSPAPPTQPPPPTQSETEVSASPNPYCNAPATSFQCPTQPDNGVSFSTSCPSFQPVIISMPCYGQRQPTPYFALPRTPQGMVRTGPFGGGFGMGSQLGSPFAMTPQIGAHGYDLEHQVGGPFGMGMQFGMGLNPFGPFGALNPFNPFNRILGAPAPNVPAPNIFQRVFKTISTTETAPYTEAHTERSGKLNFSSSTLASSIAGQSDPIVSNAQESSEDEDSAEDIDRDDQALTTPLPASEAEDSADAQEISVIVSKAAELLKPDKRKRHNPRSSGRIPQKHRYLQQL